MQTYKVKADVMLNPMQEKPVQFIVTADNKGQAKVKANAYMLKQYSQKLGDCATKYSINKRSGKWVPNAN